MQNNSIDSRSKNIGSAKSSGTPIATNTTRGWAASLFLILKWPLRVLRSISNSSERVTTRMTREGLQVAFMASFVLLGAVLRDVNLLIILAGTLLAILLVQWRVCSRTLYGLNSRRRLPRSIHARKPFDIELSITNPKRWLGSWLVLAHDRMILLSKEDASVPVFQGIALLFTSIPPNATRSQKYRCLAQRRGRYQFLGTELTTRFPMGLMRGILPPRSGDTFIVQPAIGRLLPEWKDLFDVRNLSNRQRRTRSLSDEGEFFGLRSYRSGDSPRAIHWRSSAKRNELVVKQFQQEDSQEYVILLDLHRSKTVGKIMDTTINLEDLAIEFVATLVSHIVGSNSGVITVAISDSKPEIADRIRSRSQSSHLLDRLAIATSNKDTQTWDTLRLIEREHGRVPKLVVVSTRPRVDLTLSTTNEKNVIFWNHLTWLNVGAGDLQSYFARGE